MSLRDELGFINPIHNVAHETVLNVILTGQMLMKEGQRVLRPLGLTDSQINVLMLLKYQSEDGEMNQTSLGDKLLVNRSNVTGLIDRMEQAGWVRRAADASDRRVNRVQMTDAGREILDQAEPAYFELVNRAMEKLNENEDVQLCGMLERIRHQLRIR